MPTSNKDKHTGNLLLNYYFIAQLVATAITRFPVVSRSIQSELQIKYNV